MGSTNFFKIVCESINVFEKQIIIDKNCKDLDEVYKIITSHPELNTQNNTWILYPMSIEM